jgi:hypothetical protein
MSGTSKKSCLHIGDIQMSFEPHISKKKQIKNILTALKLALSV